MKVRKHKAMPGTGWGLEREVAAKGRHSQREETALSGQEPLGGMVGAYWLAWHSRRMLVDALVPQPSERL